MFSHSTTNRVYFLYRKYRIVKPVEVPALRERLVELERQEKTMLVLRHPYLTVEQSKAIISKNKDRDHRVHWNAARNEKFSKKSLTWAEQLSHLRVTDAWE